MLSQALEAAASARTSSPRSNVRLVESNRSGRAGNRSMVIDAFDEMGTGASVRRPYRSVAAWLASVGPREMERRQKDVQRCCRELGVSGFEAQAQTVDGPRIRFDPIPRILTEREWASLDKGLVQRVRALNAFLADLYHGREIVRAGILDEHRLRTGPPLAPQMRGIDLPNDVYAPVTGIDVVRLSESRFVVLEDNMATPVGGAFVMEQRRMGRRFFPDLYAGHRLLPVEAYATTLLDTLRAASFSSGREPTVVLLTSRKNPYAYYYEHAYLARAMGIDLVEEDDLIVEGCDVFVQAPHGRKRVDVIFRRVSDSRFPENPLIGSGGALFAAVRSRRCNVVSGLGTDIAGDKAMYPLVPEMIRFYLGESPLLENVSTRWGGNTEDLRYIERHFDDLVIKERHSCGGRGVFVGPAATKTERRAMLQHVKSRPENFVAQSVLPISTCPAFVDGTVSRRHVDLRALVLSGRRTVAQPGGMTRMASSAGSLVVNLCQGGSVKDTWIMREESGCVA